MTLGYKIGAGVVIGVFGLTAIALAYRHYDGLVESKVELTEKVGTLEQDVAREKARADAFAKAIDKWDQAASTQAEALDRFSNVQREAGQYTRELKDVLSKHDLGALARAKPGLIENRVNAGTADAFRLLEQSSEGPAAGGAQGTPAAGAARSSTDQD